VPQSGAPGTHPLNLGSDMDKDRERLLAATSDLTRRAEELFQRHTSEELLWKPAPDAWSMCQCLEHLTTSLQLYLAPLSAAVSGGGPSGEGPYRYGPVARLWIRLIKPGGPKLPAPRQMRPRGAGAARPGGAEAARPGGADAGGHGTLPPADPAATLDEFREAHARLAELIRSSQGLDLSRIRMRSPVIALLRLPLGAWFETCVEHGRRHMDQAERVAGRLASGEGDGG